MRKLILILFLTCIVGVSFANNNLTLKTKARSNVYLLHNTSAQSFWIDHPIKNPSASAGWSSQIDPGHYSVLMLAMSPKGFALSCTQLARGKVNTLSCKKVLSVSPLKIYSMPKGFYHGSFWLVENVTRSAIKYRLQQRKVFLSGN